MIGGSNVTVVGREQFDALRYNRASASTFKPVNQALGYLEIDPAHPSLNSNEFTSLSGAHGERVFESYVHDDTPGAYRIFWHYGPDEVAGKKRIPVITIIAITPHH